LYKKKGAAESRSFFLFILYEEPGDKSISADEIATLRSRRQL
jgi:hypothetical protein